MDLIKSNPDIAADETLSWYWGRVYSGLLKDPESRTWYIDDRADPTNFWILLAIANPEIYMKRRGKTSVPVGHLAKAVRFMKKHPLPKIDSDDGGSVGSS
jgi:hypothetical protein